MGAIPTFKKKLLASSVSTCLLASAGGVFAQDDAVEEVLVTGMRASLEAAMDVKREAVGVVDAISAEDIGKMPDANLAESLQRIAGLSISRTNGEGAQVTVRGIDPRMNMVTLNGRNMPAVTNNGTAGDNASRAFDFANLASEGINGVEVYKTGRATNSGGGLGSTINLKTVHPLDLGENKVSLGAKAVSDTTVFSGAKGEEFTPEFSGLVNWVNDSENFGVTLTGSYQERDNSRSNAFVNNWQVKSVGPLVDMTDPENPVDYTEADLPGGADVTNMPATGELFAIPTDLRYALEDNHRERTNAQLTFQFRPIEKLTATVDYTYSEYELQADRSQQSTWYNQSAIDSLVFDQGQEVATPVIYSEAYSVDAGKDVSFAQQYFDSTTENNSFGINLAYQVTDTIDLALDYHDSRAHNLTNQTEMGLNANVTVAEYSDWSGDFPLMGVTIDDSNPDKGNNNGILDGGDVSSAMGSARWDSQDTHIKQLRLDGTIDLSEMFSVFEQSSLKVGYESRRDVNHTLMNNGTSPRITMGNWGGVNPEVMGSDWANYFTPRDFGDGFPDYDSVTGDAKFFSAGLDGAFFPIMETIENAAAMAQTRIRVNGDDPTTIDDPGTPDEVENAEDYYWVTALDAGGEHWVNRDTQLTPDNFNNFVNGRIQPNSVISLDRKIIEEVSAFYAQFHAGFDIGGMASNLLVGLRQESTDVSSISVVNVPTAQSWDGDNDWSLIYGPENENYAVNNSYDNFLPNIDFDISVMEDVKLRASYSETMARPSYTDLASAVSITDQYQKQASAGNALLEPMQSQNLDLSAEWFYAEGSYVSVALFQKEVSNFIGRVVGNAPVYNLTDPRTGARFDAAIDAIETKAANGDLNRDGTVWNTSSEAHQHDQMLLNEGLDPTDETTAIISDGRDPVQAWGLDAPQNFRDDDITGLELSVQHWFGETGIGVQANYTTVDSGLVVDNKSISQQFALLGLSDTANFVAMYDNYGLQARLAWNWRDSYLTALNQGGSNAPGYVAEYSQFDLNVSYDINENLSVSVEGLNITGEDSRLYGRSERQMFQMEDLGARWALGVRYSY